MANRVRYRNIAPTVSRSLGELQKFNVFAEMREVPFGSLADIATDFATGRSTAGATGSGYWLPSSFCSHAETEKVLASLPSNPVT